MRRTLPSEDTYYPYQKAWGSGNVPSYQGDPFTSNGDHFVGDDGYVVPNSFEEFIHVHPLFVRNWVCRRLNRVPKDPAVEDWTSELNLFLMGLPKKSIMRDRGFKDIIDIYNPWRSFGANDNRFLSYITRCLANRHFSLTVKVNRDALSHASVPLLQGPLDDDPHQSHTYETYLVSQSQALQDEINTQEKSLYTSLFVDGFLDYLEEHNPHLVDVAQLVMNERPSPGTYSYFKSRRELLHLAKVYVEGSHLAYSN